MNPPEVRIEELPDDWIYDIAAMLSEIKSAALDMLVPPLKYNYMGLTWPDFKANTAYIYKSHFELACRIAGLEGIGSANITSDYTLLYEGACKKCLAAMPVISYNTASLGITLNTLLHGERYFPSPLWLIKDGDHAVEHELL
jgi:hypothetical protein